MTLMPSSIALLFPGQGSHAEGMDEPYRGHPLFERGLELLGHDPFERLAEGTRYQQPALFLCSVAAWDQWRSGEDDDADDDAARRSPRPATRSASTPPSSPRARSSFETPSGSSTSAPTPWPTPASSAPAA